MFAEALSAIVALAQKANEPKMLPSSSSDRVVRFIHDGILREQVKEPAPRSHEPAILDEVISLANCFGDQASESDESKPVVWYDGDAIILVIDDGDFRIEHATLALAKSEVFQKLIGLRDNSPKFSQKEFVRLLRIDLAGTLEEAVLLSRVRRVKFENGTITSGRVGRGDESMGREINAKVQFENGGDIPEVVTLSVPVYSTPGETDRYSIRCAVEVDPMMGTFELIPLPDEIERVEQLAIGSIARRLKDGLNEGISFYQGKP